MKAIAIEQFGGPEVLRLVDLPRPEPGPDQVLVRMAFASVNPADWKSRTGWLKPLPWFAYSFPLVMGFDGSGVIEQLGPGVIGFTPGDRVFVRSQHGNGKWGTYAEYAVAGADSVAIVPDGLNLAEAATVPTAALSAWAGIYDFGELKSGQSILINGAAGSVGSFAVQFARATGARVAATCSAKNMDYVRGLGAEHVIDYAGDIAAGLRPWAPEGVDLVYDAVGNGTLLNGPEMARPGGRYVYISTMVPGEVLPDAEAAKARNVAIVFSTMKREDVATRLRQIADLMLAGKVRPPALDILPLAQAAEAHRRLEAGRMRGKLLLKVDPHAR